MKGKRYTTEDKIRILGEVDGGKTVLDICRERNIAEQTFYRWKRVFGMMEVSEARRLKELERENFPARERNAEIVIAGQTCNSCSSRRAGLPATLALHESPCPVTGRG